MAIATVDELRIILALLSNTNQPLKNIEKEFREKFASSGATLRALVALRVQFEESAMSATHLQSSSEVLVAFFLFSLFVDSLENLLAQTAKAGFHILIHKLEVILKEDARRMEQIKFRSSATTVNQKKHAARDSVDSDNTRLRLALKAFAFGCVMKEVDKNHPAMHFLCQDQAIVDQELERCANSAPKIRDSLLEYARAAETESSLTLGGLSSKSVANNTASTDGSPNGSSRGLFLEISPYRPPPPTLPINAHSFNVLLGTTASAAFMLDDSKPTAAWKQLVELYAKAQTAPLPESATATFAEATQTLIYHIGVSPSSIIAVAQHNLAIANVIVARLVKADVPAYVAAIINDLDPAEAQCSLLLSVADSVTPALITRLIQRGVALSAKPEGEERNAQARWFAVTITQLLALRPDLKLSNQDIDAVANALRPFPGVPEATGLLASLRK